MSGLAKFGNYRENNSASCTQWTRVAQGKSLRPHAKDVHRLVQIVAHSNPLDAVPTRVWRSRTVSAVQ